jgi:choice-of-anchor A domain-containing protein
MKLYDNVPQAIREGIFCLMTGTLVFATNSITAEASDGEPSDESGNDNTSESVDVSSVEKQAADLIDYSDAEPISPQPEVTKTETPSEDVTTTTSTYQETVSNNEVISVGDNVVVIEDNEASEPKVVATATTQETVQETVTKNLTKDTENVTVVQDGNTVTTTGEFVEDIKTTVTTSSTTVVTDDENIAKEIQKQISNEENNNTESSGVEFGSLTEKYYVTDKNGKRTHIDNKLAEGATSLILETKDGDSDPAIIVNDKEVPLSNVSDYIKNALVNSSSIEIASRFEDATTFTLGGKTLIQAEIDILSENSISEDTTFIIAPAADGKSGFDVTYVDENGQYITVSDSLKQLILDKMDRSVTPDSLRYNSGKEYEDVNSEKLKSEMEAAKADGYVLVAHGYGTGTHEETIILDTIYDTLEDAQDALDDFIARGIYDGGNIIPHPQNDETRIINDFDGFSITTKEEYERIINLNDKEVVDGETIYKETTEDGKTIYYKVNTVDETFTILSQGGSAEVGHQETSFIINGVYYHYDQNSNFLHDNMYGIDQQVFVDQMNSVLATPKTSKNTLKYSTGSGPRPEKNKLEITDGGTYYIDGTVKETWILLTTPEKVTIILTGTDTILPVITTDSQYQNIQTGNKSLLNAAIMPDVTFVTNATTLRTQGTNEVGNILAPNTKVTLGGGNFCGTIICSEINGGAEGHWYPAGSKGYLVDRKVIGAANTEYYTLNAKKQAFNYVVTGIKTIDIDLDKTVNNYEYKRSLVILESTYEVKFSEYSKESTRGVWTETKTIDVPPTPPVIVEVPPTPPTPPTTTPPTDTVVVVNEQDPVSEVPQVLGAKRDMPQVLGARRARTGDMTQNPLVASMMILGASAVALGALASLKKRR